MIITSLDNKKIKDIKRLNERKYRDKEGLFLIEGKHLVLEAFKNGVLNELLLEEKEPFKLDIKTTYVTKAIIKELSSLSTPTTILGICRKKKKSDTFSKQILILDNIQDPGNLGTIIRSAVAFNISTIVLGKGTVDAYNPKVLRATQGLIFNINFIESDLANAINNLKEEGYTIIGTSLTDGIEVKKYKKNDKFALIMGNEGHGISKNIENTCDDFVYIKMNNECESLNVSIACSIILYQLSE